MTKKILIVLMSLFIARVLAQIIQLIHPVEFLPSFESWQSGSLPYPILLILQIIIIAIMFRFIKKLKQNKLVQSPQHSHVLQILGIIYFILMIFRLVAGFTFGQDNAFLNAFIPTLFHFVLAGFLYMMGVAYRQPHAN